MEENALTVGGLDKLIDHEAIERIVVAAQRAVHVGLVEQFRSACGFAERKAVEPRRSGPLGHQRDAIEKELLAADGQREGEFRPRVCLAGERILLEFRAGGGNPDSRGGLGANAAGKEIGRRGTNGQRVRG